MPIDTSSVDLSNRARGLLQLLNVMQEALQAMDDRAASDPGIALNQTITNQIRRVRSAEDRINEALGSETWADQQAAFQGFPFNWDQAKWDDFLTNVTALFGTNLTPLYNGIRTNSAAVLTLDFNTRGNVVYTAPLSTAQVSALRALLSPCLANFD